MRYEIYVPRVLVDVHAHYLTDRYVRAARAAGVDHPDGMPAWPSWSVESHLELMDRHDIARAVLSISSPGVHFGDDAAARGLASHVNDHAAEVSRERPDRFGFFGALPLPDVIGAVQEAERVLDDLGADGVGLLSNHCGSYLSDPSLEPLWEVLDARAAVVHVHPTSPVGWEHLPPRPRPMLEFPFETTRTFVELLLAGVTSRHPRIRFIASHCGGALPLLVERVERFLGAFAAGPTPAVRAPMSRLWFDSAGTPFPEPLPALAGVVGEDRIVYGSDYCFTPPAAVAGALGSIAAAAPPRSAPSWTELMTRNAHTLFAPDSDSATVASPV